MKDFKKWLKKNSYEVIEITVENLFLEDDTDVLIEDIDFFDKKEKRIGTKTLYRACVDDSEGGTCVSSLDDFRWSLEEDLDSCYPYVWIKVKNIK